VLARHQQVHQVYLVQNVVGSSQEWMNSVHALTPALQYGTAALSDAQTGAYLRLYQSLQAQANVLSYIDVLGMLALFCACMVPMALLMQKPPKGKGNGGVRTLIPHHRHVSHPSRIVTDNPID
jgi:MFS transporter, DHA2 family, multidrug resistance protein